MKKRSRKDKAVSAPAMKAYRESKRYSSAH